MTQTAVTELIVRGDGALATLGQFENAMEKAGTTTDQTTGAVADFERRMATARARIEQGNSVLVESVARKTADQRAWERWSATVDRTQALRIRLEREAAQASVAAANAVNLGYATQEQALQTLTALERRHADQLRAVAEQHQNAAQAATNQAAANDNLARSSSRAAAQSGVGNNMNTANVAAQFQDIGVTAAMGMSPMMIALQQGTQLSAVLNSMQSPLRGLAAAFVSIVNPVSLLTIGFVALGAAAVQWFMAASSANDNAIVTLEQHREKLDELLAGYEAAAEAADDVLTRQAKAPEASVQSDLTVFRQDALERYEETLSRVRQEQARFQDDINLTLQSGAGEPQFVAQWQRVLDIVTETGLSANTSTDRLARLHTELTLIQNTSADDTIAYTAEELRKLVEQAMDGKTAVDSLDASLRTLPTNITINLRIQESVQAATDAAITGIEQLRQLEPELRSAREQAADALTEALKAPDAILRAAGQAQYNRTIAGLDEQDRHREAEKAARSAGGGGGGRTFYDMVETSHRSIGDLLLQAETMGMAGQAAAALRHEQEMLNQAANDNIALTPVQIEQVSALAEQMAQAEAAVAGAQFALGNPDPWQQAMDNIANLDAALATGAISWEEYGVAAFRANSGAAASVLGLASGLTGALSQMFQDNKAFAVANAVVSTAEAVMKALSTYGPTPWGFAAAGVAAATGAAQIATIMSAQKGSSGAPKAPRGGGAASGGGQAAKAPQRVTQINLNIAGNGMITRADLENLMDQMADGLSDGLGERFKVQITGGANGNS